MLGGNLVAALAGGLSAYWFGHELAPALVGMALGMLLMFALRCLHPPSCALALSVALNPSLSELGIDVVWPILLSTLVLIGCALLLQQPDALSLPAPLPAAAGQSPWHPRPGAERANGLLRPGPGPGAARLRRIRRHHPRRPRATDPPHRALRLAPAHGRADRGTDHVPRRADRQHRDLHRRRLEAVAGPPPEGPAGARRASAAGRHRHPERPAQTLPPRRQPVQAPALPARDQAEDDHDHPGGLRTEPTPTPSNWSRCYPTKACTACRCSARPATWSASSARPT